MALRALLGHFAISSLPSTNPFKQHTSLWTDVESCCVGHALMNFLKRSIRWLWSLAMGFIFRKHRERILSNPLSASTQVRKIKLLRLLLFRRFSLHFSVPTSDCTHAAALPEFLNNICHHSVFWNLFDSRLASLETVSFMLWCLWFRFCLLNFTSADLFYL